MTRTPDALRLRTIAPWIVLVLALSAAPYAIAAILTPRGAAFSGALINPDDASVYLSALRQGAAGEWLFHFAFSPEPLPPRVTYLLYLLAGRLMPLIGAPPVVYFHALRLGLGAITLVALVFWVRRVFPEQTRHQLTAWLLIVFGAGIGWLFIPWMPGEQLLVPDLRVPEWTLFMALFHTPHFALGVGLEALLFGCLIEMTREANGARWALRGAVAALGLGLVYPYHIPVAGLIGGVYLLSLAVQRRRLPWRDWLHGAIAIAPLVPLAYYFGVYARADPYWEVTHILDNVIPPPPIAGVAIGYGLIGPLALIGGWEWIRHHRNPMLPVWAAVNFIALYLPVPFSGRFALGLIVPVATLAAYGLEQRALPWLQRTRLYAQFARWTPTPLDSLRRVVILLTVPSTVMLALVTIRTITIERDYPYYLPAGEVQAADWLARHSRRDDLILAFHPMGNYLPRVITGKVFLGQIFLTVNWPEKLELLQRFWDGSTPTGWREQFVREWGITYLYRGRFEQTITRGSVTPPGHIVYQAEGVTIYSMINDQ